MTTTTHTEFQHTAPAICLESGTQSAAKKALWTGRVLSYLGTCVEASDAQFVLNAREQAPDGVPGGPASALPT